MNSLTTFHLVIIVLGIALIAGGRYLRGTRPGLIALWLGIASLLTLASTFV